MNDNGAWTDRRDELLARVMQQGRARKLRRGLVGAASVAVVAAVVMFGVVVVTANPTRSVRVLNPSGPIAPAPTGPVVRPAGVLLIGDSVMLGARDALERDVPGARVNAGVSRQFHDAIPILQAARDAGALPRIIVVHMGTNGAFAPEQFTQLMQTVGPGSDVYFLTVSMPRSWEQAVNEALFSDVPRWPNAHVLDWHSYADGMPWFTADGIHLDADGVVQYARFIGQGIERPETFSDPFAGAPVPASGFYVTSDPKAGADQGPSSFAVTLYDEDGRERGVLPRATIDSRVMNVERKSLVVTDSGIRLAAVPLGRVAGVPDGCTQTEANHVLAVALCGRSGGPDLLLGDRILVNLGSGWQPLITKPPGAGGGHWNWASPSPDGQWVLAAWSAECEVVTSVFIRVADGAVHAVTGEPGIAGPESGELGWTSSGDALAVFGGDAACGTPAPHRRGVYAVSPTEGVRRLLLPLAPDAGVVHWSTVDDQRTRPDASRSSVQVDLDGDGRADRLAVTATGPGGIGPVELSATLADGRVVSGTIPGGYSVSVAATADIAGDGRHEVILTVGGETWTLGAIVVLDGDRLVAITQTPDEQIIGWGQHTNSDPYGTTDVACRVVGSQESLVLAESSLEGGDRHWRRSVYALDGARLVLRRRDAGTIIRGAQPPPGLPLANALDC